LRCCVFATTKFGVYGAQLVNLCTFRAQSLSKFNQKITKKRLNALGYRLFLVPTFGCTPVPPCVGFECWASEAWTYIHCWRLSFIFYFNAPRAVPLRFHLYISRHFALHPYQLQYFFILPNASFLPNSKALFQSLQAPDISLRSYFRSPRLKYGVAPVGSNSIALS